MKRNDIFKLVEAERARQNELHPEFPHSSGHRLAVLTEEVGEVAKAILDMKNSEMKKELIEVAAVAVRWLEQIE